MAFRFLSRLALAGLLLMLAGLAHADSWVRPSLRVVSSQDGQALARVTPGDFKDDRQPEAALYAYDAKRGQYVLTARFPLRNRLAPAEVLLTGRGELVALDEWAGVGRGTVLTVYAPDGTPRLQFTLHQLLGAEAADQAPQSVSSTWWRCRRPQLSQDGTRLLLDTYDDGSLRVELGSGKVEYEAGNGRCQ